MLTELGASKCCSACKAQLPLTAFGPQNGGKNGLRAACKPCRRDAHRAYALANSEAIKARGREYMREWRKANPEEARSKHLKWAKENPDKAEAATKAWRKANQEHVLRVRASYQAANSEKIRKVAAAVSRRWRAENRVMVAVHGLRRKAAMKQRTPAWAGSEWERFAMSEVYDLATKRTKSTGVLHQVDHIVPIRGKTVSGMHCFANLQVITHRENMAKSNRHWPQMP